MQVARVVTVIGLVTFLSGCNVCKVMAKRSSDEEPALITEAKTIEQDRFVFQYPGNWRVLDQHVDYDPDHNFRIWTPGGKCHVFFEIVDGYEDPVKWSEKSKSTTTIALSDDEVTAADSWGSFEGSGFIIEGELVGLPQTNRVFSHGSEDLSFQVEEGCTEYDMHYVEPGFELIRSTFAVKELESE